ncbi:MAG TPA: SUMF1/EgtB/PvdO family nonheme iron enzyme [Polyangiaceae bacterium]
MIPSTNPKTTRSVPFRRLRALIALALPGCLLVDPPEDVLPDEAGGSGNSAGLAGNAGNAPAGGKGGGSGGTGGGAGSGGTSGITGGTTGGGGVAGKGAAGNGGTGGSSGRSSTAGGASGTAGTSGAATSGASAGGSSGNASAGAGATSAGNGGSAGTGPAANCGNGVVEAGEGCDDDGTSPGDGCSPTCQLESGWNCTTDSTSICTATHPSCAGMTGNECQGEDCCGDLLVRGGTFRQGDATEGTFESSVAEFRLDKYEVTVERFRAFWDAYDGWVQNNPSAGAGANPSIGGSGWNTDWDLAPTASELVSELDCGTVFRTWVGSAGNDTLPMNCINWFTAFAFCIWDGGRLPTEAEWEFAARWGGYQYLYPWGDEPALTNQQDSTAEYAVYNCLGDGSAPASCDVTDILPVGSRPAGGNRYGNQDMIGSLFEWTLDIYATYPTTPRMNYARVDASDASSPHTVRGGSWNEDAAHQTTVFRTQYEPSVSISYVGFRCARSN